MNDNNKSINSIQEVYINNTRATVISTTITNQLQKKPIGDAPVILEVVQLFPPNTFNLNDKFLRTQIISKDKEDGMDIDDTNSIQVQLCANNNDAFTAICEQGNGTENITADAKNTTIGTEPLNPVPTVAENMETTKEELHVSNSMEDMNDMDESPSQIEYRPTIIIKDGAASVYGDPKYVNTESCKRRIPSAFYRPAANIPSIIKKELVPDHICVNELLSELELLDAKVELKNEVEKAVTNDLSNKTKKKSDKKAKKSKQKKKLTSERKSKHKEKPTSKRKIADKSISNKNSVKNIGLSNADKYQLERLCLLNCDNFIDSHDKDKVTKDSPSKKGNKVDTESSVIKPQAIIDSINKLLPKKIKKIKAKILVEKPIIQPIQSFANDEIPIDKIGSEKVNYVKNRGIYRGHFLTRFAFDNARKRVESVEGKENLNLFETSIERNKSITTPSLSNLETSPIPNSKLKRKSPKNISTSTPLFPRMLTPISGTKGNKDTNTVNQSDEIRDKLTPNLNLKRRRKLEFCDPTETPTPLPTEVQQASDNANNNLNVTKPPRAPSKRKVTHCKVSELEEYRISGNKLNKLKKYSQELEILKYRFTKLISMDIFDSNVHRTFMEITMRIPAFPRSNQCLTTAFLHLPPIKPPPRMPRNVEKLETFPTITYISKFDELFNSLKKHMIMMKLPQDVHILEKEVYIDETYVLIDKDEIEMQRIIAGRDDRMPPHPIKQGPETTHLFRYLPEGKIGRVIRFKSGKIRLIMAGIKFNIKLSYRKEHILKDVVCVQPHYGGTPSDFIHLGKPKALLTAGTNWRHVMKQIRIQQLQKRSKLFVIK